MKTEVLLSCSVIAVSKSETKGILFELRFQRIINLQNFETKIETII